MAEAGKSFPVVMVALLGVVTAAALTWWSASESPPPVDEQRSAAESASEKAKSSQYGVVVRSDSASVELADPALRLGFFGPNGERSHVIREGDVPESQRRCVQIVHPELPEEKVFLADFRGEGSDGDAETVTGRKVSKQRARGCSDAAWAGSRLGTHIGLFAAEWAKLHPDSERVESSERASELLRESTDAPDATRGW